ncbi:Sodium:dicarboxylate symporter (plasmid) [Sodalis praecaptivus]|uniref:Sodium:dicarboxylate symporter n=1 Tax=Sodalis praecaptivus TaxID=1239307 RepID=W0I429_9GAMM|nr:dicarboxylate/amino acid:cation symporter [Sodalis praecaptivus]AHF79225.1 Sodium:dicarboxylate symporter [Sodalis praecaptivus]
MNKTKKPFYKTIYFEVLIGVVLGILLGHFWPSLAVKMAPLGEGFIKLIKMMIGVIVFCTIVTGVAGMRDMKKVGRVGGKALIYFEVISTFSLLIGLIGGHILNPGKGFNVRPESLDASLVQGYIEKAQHLDFVSFLMHIIPDSVVSAFVQGNILSILLIAVLFGWALTTLGEAGRQVFNVIDGFSQVFFKIVNMIIRLSSIGAFGAIAFTVGQYGAGSLGPLMKLVGGFYVLCIFFVIVVLGFVCHLCHISIFKFVNYIKDELLIVLGTSSSEVVMPQIMAKMEKLGCSKSAVGLIIPTGYSFNLDGTNLYLTMAVVFISQAMNIDLSLTDQLIIIGVGMLTSKGASGIAGAAFVMLTSTLLIVPIVPVQGMVLILGVHRFLGTGLAMTNLVGNGVACLVVSAWEKELDFKKLDHEIRNPGQEIA